MSTVSATKSSSSCSSTRRAKGKLRRRMKRRRRKRRVRSEREGGRERKRGTTACLAGRRLFRVRASSETKRLHSARHFPFLWSRGATFLENNRSVLRLIILVISHFLRHLVAVCDRATGAGEWCNGGVDAPVLDGGWWAWPQETLPKTCPSSLKIISPSRRGTQDYGIVQKLCKFVCLSVLALNRFQSLKDF